jgi:hypothetical protein
MAIALLNCRAVELLMEAGFGAVPVFEARPESEAWR